MSRGKALHFFSRRVFCTPMENPPLLTLPYLPNRGRQRTISRFFSWLKGRKFIHFGPIDLIASFCKDPYLEVRIGKDLPQDPSPHYFLFFPFLLFFRFSRFSPHRQTTLYLQSLNTSFFHRFLSLLLATPASSTTPPSSWC